MRQWIAVMALASSGVFAHEVELSNCIIQEVLPGKHMTAAFVTFNNETDKTMILEKAELKDISDHIELHEMVNSDGVMRMQEIHQLTVAPGITELKKGGYHVMVMDIDSSPSIGSEHELSFVFKDGTRLSCQAEVLSLENVMAHFGGGSESMDHAHSEMDHDKMDHEHDKASESHSSH